MDDKKICNPYHRQKAHKLTNCNEKKNEKCNEKDINKLLYARKLKLEKPRTIKKNASQSEAEWDENLIMAKITKFANNITKNFGHSWNKAIYLYPEECLFLLEKNSLILRWKGNELSFQNAFTLLLAEGSSCTYKQYKTYSYLKKMGFRVFKFDNKLNQNNCSLPNLTKLPEKSARKKNNNSVKNNQKFQKKNTHLVNSSLGDNVCFPKIAGTNWVVVSTPPQCYLPHNLQPCNNIYMFNITKGRHMEITAMLSDYYSENYKKKPFFEKESIVYESPPTGMYPVYEKNIPKREELMVKAIEKNNYEPKKKKLKLLNTNKDDLPVAINLTSNLSYLVNANVTNTETKNINTMTASSSFVNTNVTNTETKNINTMTASSSFVNTNVTNTETKNVNTMTASSSFVNANLTNTETNSEHDKAEPFQRVTENEKCSMESRIPSHIREKLFAIKLTEVKYEFNTNSDYSIRYDVYYPNNHFPKKNRPVADFRVIVFEDYLNNFPNIYDVNASNPHDNVPTLWAIVNSGDVSFYNVNNITLPKPTDWKIV
ncbi:tRNA-splicing endonuclease, subunit Sen54, N-terminal [Cinara cedri]|uniref:tRNA-splicing endonuclease, subunit Sen54, N-terminal n=1 Tax=Cinara cedri TaxID=506608 RepID=A0A5E4MW02_9HEMI|nr:tRNA-splicing endonuclease, subunit Sen54, N-terminal [Cinara cedri]